MKKKNLFIDLFKVFISNLLVLLSGILIGFVLPKITGVDEYAYYKTFTLYVSYIGILHFGICDGCYLYFSGKKISEISKKKIHSLIVSFILLEALIMAIVLIISLFAIDNADYKLIFIFVFIYMFIANIENLFILISQATKLFNVSSLFGSIKALLNCVWILSLYIVYKVTGSLILNYPLFILLHIIVFLVSDICYFGRFYRYIFTKGEKVSDTLNDLKDYIKLGLPLMLANFSTTIIILIDRQIVSIYYPIDLSNTFAYYAFAYSMLNLITVMTNSISVVLYPYMKNKNKENLTLQYQDITCLILIFIAFALSLYFPLEWFINTFLEKYTESIPIFRVILPGLVPNIMVTVVMHNYYKYLNKENFYLLGNAISLILKVIISFLIYYLVIEPYFSDNPIALSISSTIIMIIWYFLTEVILLRYIKIKHFKHDIFIFLLMTIFYLISFAFSEWLGFIIYLLVICTLLFIYYGKEINKFILKKEDYDSIILKR